MGRFATFISGFILGGVATYGAMNYHVVYTDEGVQLVPKVAANLQDIYVDIREFGLSDWNEHRNLAAALMKSEKSHLFGESVKSELRNSLDQTWQNLTSPKP